MEAIFFFAFLAILLSEEYWSVEEAHVTHVAAD